MHEGLHSMVIPVVSMKILRFHLKRFTMCIVGKKRGLLQRDGEELLQLFTVSSKEGVQKYIGYTVFPTEG